MIEQSSVSAEKSDRDPHHQLILHQPFLHAPVLEFKNLIESDPCVYMLFNQMFEQVFSELKKQPQVIDYLQMLHLIDSILTQAPKFDDKALVLCPINAIFVWPMGTTSGFVAFLNKEVNRCLKKILNHWASFLESEDSKYVLTKYILC